jgi:hypothetical protein
MIITYRGHVNGFLIHWMFSSTPIIYLPFYTMYLDKRNDLLLRIIRLRRLEEGDSASLGSMRFVGGGVSVQTNVSFITDAALLPGTSAFTIEWFQYYQDSDQNAIVFSIGTFPSNDLCVVYVGTTLFLFTDGSSSSVGSAVTKNVWQHVAVVGNGGASGSRNVKVYVDGQLKLTRTADYNINQTDALRIGNQTNATLANGNYAGLLTNFRWVVGSQVYATNFTPPASPLTAITGTELLLLASNASDVVKDSSVKNRSPTNTGVTFDSTSPF